MTSILLVEDSQNDVELTLTALEDCGFSHTSEISVVRDGEEAMDFLYRRGGYSGRKVGHPTVVLLDLKLPKKNGLEVLQEMRAVPELCSIPVVMLTSSKETQDIAISYTHGVNAYVVKPVSFPEFTNAIRDLGMFWAVLNQPPPSSLGA